MPGARYTDDSTVITNFVISVPLARGATVLLSSKPATGILGDQVFIGASVGGARSVMFGGGDFVLMLLNFDTLARYTFFNYTPVGPLSTPIYNATSGNVTGVAVDAPAGLIAVGCILPFLLRRRRASAVVRKDGRRVVAA